MSRNITIQLFLLLFVAAVLVVPTVAGAPTSSRTMPTSANMGAPITVNIAVSDYGSAGEVSETLPAGFIYVDSTIPVSQVKDGINTVTFTLFGETNFDYTIIASKNIGTYAFNGIIRDFDNNEFTVGGDTSILIVEENGEQPNDSTPDEQTSTPNTQTTQVESESSDSENIDENPVESETPVEDTNTESSKSVNTNPTTESTEDIPESEATPFITTFGIIVIGVIATLVHKMRQ